MCKKKVTRSKWFVHKKKICVFSLTKGYNVCLEKCSDDIGSAVCVQKV